LRSELGEALFVVEAVCIELQYTQVLAAFSDRDDAQRFIKQQDTEFRCFSRDGDPIWLPESVLGSLATLPSIDFSKLGKFTDGRPTRASIDYVIFEIPWNQMLGRFLPVTKDGHPGPTLQPAEGCTAPVAEIVKLAKPQIHESTLSAAPGARARVAHPPLPPEEQQRRARERLRLLTRGE
jgi:hypothetical protein